jgi:hypothetical protein
MDSPEKGPQVARWRAMASSDLGEVNALANEIHVNYPEDDSVFREKFVLFPYGCFSLEASNSIVGYCISHPWTKGMPPALNAMMGNLPSSPSTYFIHDIAVSANYRRRGSVQFLIGLLPIVARLFRLEHLTLISVNQTELFWRKFGFKDTLDSDLQQRVREKYSEEAVHMEKTIDAHF